VSDSPTILEGGTAAALEGRVPVPSAIRARNQPLPGVRSRCLQQLERLHQGRRARSRLGIVVGTPVAPELDRAVRQLAGSVGKLGCAAVKRDGAVREVVPSVARGGGRQCGGQLDGPRGEFLGAVVDLVHAWGGLDVDIRFYFHGAGCQFAGTVLDFVRPGGRVSR
jgi:hypothetical protein